MPLPTRDLTAVRAPAAQEGDLRERALEVLLDPSLASVVALVCWRDGEVVRVADSRGRVVLTCDGRHLDVQGRDPVADDDPYSDDGYPLAAVRLHSLFDEPRAPDLAVVHTGTHWFVDRGGHPGEHGSLNGLQSRAPLLLSGTGVVARGVVERYARTVDVGATLAHLVGAPHDDMDGTPVDLVEPGAKHVVGLLWDGAAHGELLALEAAGELPGVSRLLARGCALRGGAVAEFPSVTLVNHTCALTGVGPGRHGIVNNAYFDRETGEQVVPNSPDTWHRAMEHLRPGVRTVWQRLPPGTASACIDEPADTGAGYSTFALVRDGAVAGDGGRTGSLLGTLPPAAQDPHATVEHTGGSEYEWGTRVDAVGLQQVLGLWREGEPPRLTWWNSTLTDGAHHAGGPGSPQALASLRDTDRRLGVWLDLVEERGLLDDVVVLLTADHGMQGADPAVTGDWDGPLRAAGIPFRDEAYGFLYLGEDVAGA